MLVSLSSNQDSETSRCPEPVHRQLPRRNPPASQSVGQQTHSIHSHSWAQPRQQGPFTSPGPQETNSSLATCLARSHLQSPMTLLTEALAPQTSLEWLQRAQPRTSASACSCSPPATANTVPCIPEGPKSCRVRKTTWSWCSAWLGSWRC